MYEQSWIDPIYYWFMIILGLSAALCYLYYFLTGIAQWDKWYVLFKASYGLYIAVIFFLIWHPNLLSDPWVTRQCVRGVVCVAGITLNLDVILRTYRRKLGC